MSLNRMSRDQIVTQALDMVDSAALDHKDRPGGALQPEALSIMWLQEGIDYIHRRYPFGAQVVSGALSLAQGASTSTVPTDYLLDLQDGITITSPTNKARRLRKTSRQRMLDLGVTNLTRTGCPSYYCIVGSTIQYGITTDQAYSGTLAYYKLPTVLSASTVPDFPDDFTLVEYVRLRGQEWQGQAPQGTAMAYATGIIAALRQSGLGQEAETTSFPLDPTIFHYSGNEQFGGSAWLGDAVPR